ncbi:ntpase [Trichoderma arundinaceum]|uniref:inosine/xanthosine triphosphatase n=1 Tax=Trichoderma arundinaceum TaxID=490622 RepID=A0A395N9R3_TRIAR|nr:ntpase [Trichoderma arundinaceum]
MADQAVRVVVASRNPVKISAAREGFSGMFPSEKFSFTGVSVPSGVAEQPMTDAETLQGARNRAFNARDAEPQADYWVGIEGGVDDSGDAMETFAWVVVLGKPSEKLSEPTNSGASKPERMGRARTAAFFQPEEVASLVRGGMELGPADDQVFGSENSKQHSGSIGLLTGDLINRFERINEEKQEDERREVGMTEGKDERLK